MKSGIRRYPAALAMALAAAQGEGQGRPQCALGWRDRCKWPAGYRHPQTREKARRLRQMSRAAAKQPVELADAA